MYRKEDLFETRKKLELLYKAQIFGLILTVIVSLLGLTVFLLSVRYIGGMIIGNIIIFIAYMISTKQVKVLNKINYERDTVEYNLAYTSYKSTNNS